MTTLVTGASGFVGQHLTAHLAEEGDEVVAWAGSRQGPDLTDQESVERTLAANPPRVVYHLAGAADVGASWSDPVGTFHANATGSLHLLMACAKVGVERLVMVSSAAVYGSGPPSTTSEGAFDETSPLMPVSPYAASKAAAEQLAIQAWVAGELDVVIARPFNHIGPGQSTAFVASALAHRVAEAEATGGTEIEVGNLTPRRDFTDVRDVVRAYRLIASQASPGMVLNVCTGQAVAIEQIAEHLVGLARSPMRLCEDPRLVRSVEVDSLSGDPTRLRELTGWAPRIPLETTLSDLLTDARRRVSDRLNKKATPR